MKKENKKKKRKISKVFVISLFILVVLFGIWVFQSTDFNKVEKQDIQKEVSLPKESNSIGNQTVENPLGISLDAFSNILTIGITIMMGGIIFNIVSRIFFGTRTDI